MRSFPDRPWDTAHVFHSRNYSVRANTDMQAAQYVLQLMEIAAYQYREVFGCRYESIPRLTVHVYATRPQFVHEVQTLLGQNLPMGAGGLFLPDGPGAIHLPYVRAPDGAHPSRILFHEGTHQFVHTIVNMRVPSVLRGRIPEEVDRLVSVPIWLNEGLATYMETARYDGDGLEIGRVNANRLSQLQGMLRRNAHPSVREVVARRYGQPFYAEHYAVAWGLVYMLRHDWREDAQASGRRRLVEYITACRNGFYHAPSRDFAEEFLATGRLPDDFVVQWHARLGEKSLAAFERLIVPSHQTFADWEAEWTARILRLDPRKPYGGTDLGESVGARSSANFHGRY